MEKLRHLIGFLYRHNVTRYLVVGGTTFIIDLGLLILLHSYFKVSLSIATSISFWVSVIYNFTLNRSWTFSAKENKKLHEHLFTYGLLLGFNYIYTVLSVSFLSTLLPYPIAKAISVITQTSWTYFIYRRYIFNSPNPSIASSIE